MKFGKLEDTSGVDFTLPNDHPVTQQVLNGSPRVPKFFLGGTMWNIRDWKGTWYPPKTPIRAFPEAYCTQFNTIELNATHYKIHPAETIRKWKNFASGEFIFSPKFPNLISHYRQFNNCDGLTDEFLEAVSAFEERLGPCFIQLPERTSPNQAEKISRYLETLPQDISIAMEFRHPDWFAGDERAEQVWQQLQKQGISSVISDTAGRRDAMHMRMTSRKLILRFGGCEMNQQDKQRFSDWTDRIALWAQNGLEEVHVWMHQPDSILTPEAVICFGELLENRFNTRIKLPSLVTQSTDLFS